MPLDIAPNAPLYVKLADAIAAEIRKGTSGELPPGALLPSESQLQQQYGISRTPIRGAIAALRAAGLIEVRQGIGSVVLAPPPAEATVPRGVTRSGSAYTLPGQAEAGAPVISRCTIAGLPAELLGMPGADAISVDRTLTDPTTGIRTAHRLYIPLATASEVPMLHDHPETPLDQVYGHLHAAGLTPQWTEEVGARASTPDDRTALAVPDAGVVLIAYRLTHTKNRPLLCEELRVPATHARLSYPITATTAKRTANN